MKGAEWTAWVGALLALPFALVLTTAYVKFAVVLAILRRGFGESAILSRFVVSALALLFALFVAAPTTERMWVAFAPALQKGDVPSLVAASSRAAEPVREFLRRHTGERERQRFIELQRELRPAESRSQVGENDLTVLAASFVTAELKRGFEIGFLLFLPFLVIDLLVAMVLSALGVEALAPEAVALPLKLLLFVLADGWQLLFRGLLMGYR